MSREKIGEVFVEAEIDGSNIPSEAQGIGDVLEDSLTSSAARAGQSAGQMLSDSLHSVTTDTLSNVASQMGTTLESLLEDAGSRAGTAGGASLATTLSHTAQLAGVEAAAVLGTSMEAVAQVELTRAAIVAGQSIEGALSRGMDAAGIQAGTELAAAFEDAVLMGQTSALATFRSTAESETSEAGSAAGTAGGTALGDAFTDAAAQGSAAAIGAVEAALSEVPSVASGAGAAGGDAMGDALVDGVAGAGSEAAERVASEAEGAQGSAAAAGSLLGDALSTAFGVALYKLGEMVMSAAGQLIQPLRDAFDTGLGRLRSMDDAQARLRGLNITGAELESVMESATDSVTGTIYTMGDAANAAGLLMSTGIDSGEQLDTILQGITTTATATGREFSEITGIFQAIEAQGTITGRELYMLRQSGVDALTQIAEHFGITTEAAQRMVDEGKIGAEEFAEVMNGTLGNMAEEMARTMSGMATNLRSRMGGLAEDAMMPFYEGVRTVMEPTLELLAEIRPALAPIWEAVGERVAPVFERWAQAIRDLDVSRIGDVADAIADLIRGDISFEDIIDQLGQFNPVLGGVLEAAIDARNQLGPIFEQLGEAAFEFASVLIAELLPVIPDLIDAFFQLLPSLIDLIPPLADLLAALVPILPPLVELATAVIPPLVDALVLLVDYGLIPLLDTVISLTGGHISALTTSLDEGLAPAMADLMEPARTLADYFGIELPEALQTSEASAQWFNDTFDLIGEAITALVDGDFNRLLEIGMEWLDLAEQWTGIDYMAIFESLQESLAGLTETFEWVRVTAAEVWADIQTGLETIRTIWDTVWTVISTVIETAWETIKTIVSGAILVIVALFTGDFSSIQDIVNRVWERIKSIFANAGTNIGNAVRNAASTVRTNATTMMNNMREAVSTGISRVLTFFRELPGRIVAALSNVGSRMASVGRDIIQGMINGITSMIGSAISAVTGAVNSVINGAKGVLGISSPSRVFRDEVGRMIGEGMALGIEDSTKDAVDSAYLMTSRAIREAQRPLAEPLRMQMIPGLDVNGRVPGAISGGAIDTMFPPPVAPTASTGPGGRGPGGESRFVIVDRKGAVMMEIEGQLDDAFDDGTQGNLRSELGVSR